MEAFILGFWLVAVPVAVAAIAKLWLVDSQPGSGGHKPNTAF